MSDARETARKARKDERAAAARRVKAAELEGRAASLTHTIATLDVERQQCLIRAAVLRYGHER